MRHDRQEMSDSSIRILRWTYSQHDDTLTCELRLADDGLSYQLTTISAAHAADQTVERFKDVTDAFQRQCDLERQLVSAGWSLESYESQVRAADAENAREASGRSKR
jgi:hypothetical protein